MADSIEYNGVDLSGSSYGVTLMEAPVPIVSSPRINLVEIAQRHGGYSQGGYLGNLQLRCKIAIIGTSFANLQTKLDNLNFLLAPENGDKKIKFDFLTDRYWLGRLSNNIAPPPIGAESIVANLTFTCPSPLAYDNTLTTQTESTLGATQTVDVPSASGSTVGGNAITYPIWQFQAQTGGGTLTQVGITNQTTSEVLSASYSVAETAYIRFDSETEIIEYSVDGSTWTNINSSRSNTNRKFPTLSSRVQNSFTVALVGSVDTDLTITYRNRYRS